jgi:C-terminal processing protease CtpA/Prc
VVRDLIAGGPAHRSGLKPGDVILGVKCASTGGKMLRNPTPGALFSLELALRPSERVTYEVQRGDRSMRFTTSAVGIERLVGNPNVEAGGGQKQLSLFE